MSESEAVSEPEAAAGEARQALKWPCILITLALMITGLMLLWRKPLWLHPPLFTTLLIYATLAWVWLPTAIVCLSHQPRRSRRQGILTLILGLFVGSLIFCTVLSSGLNLWLFDSQTTTCERSTLPQDRVRYECSLSLFNYYESYIFEGSANGPFLRLVARRTGGS